MLIIVRRMGRMEARKLGGAEIRGELLYRSPYQTRISPLLMGLAGGAMCGSFQQHAVALSGHLGFQFRRDGRMKGPLRSVTAEEDRRHQAHSTPKFRPCAQ